MADDIEQVILSGLVARRVEVEGPDFDYADERLIAYAKSVRTELEESGFVLLPPGGEVSTDWVVKVTRLDGLVHYTPAVDREHAELMADNTNQHVASLNEPTRRLMGIQGAELVCRSVTTWPDGSELRGPWSPVVSDNETTQWVIRDHTGTYGVSTTDERAIRRSWTQGITWWDPDGSYELCRRDGDSGTWEVVERHPVVSDNQADRDGEVPDPPSKESSD